MVAPPMPPGIKPDGIEDRELALGNMPAELI
jgi:hypothetical protein